MSAIGLPEIPTGQTQPVKLYLLIRACELLLHSTLPVSEIAGQVGFTEVTYFISSFKKGIGETPLQYRKNHVSRQRASGSAPGATVTESGYR